MENKERKIVRHFDRCSNRSYETPTTVVHLERHTLQKVSEYDEKIGRVITKSKFVKVDRHEEMKNYRPQDFCMENIIAIGAVGNQVQAKLQSSSDQFVSDVLNQLSNN